MNFKRLLIVLVLVFGVWTPCACADDAELREQFFHKHVEPILVGRCLECHGADRKGELDLRTQATSLTGGESGACIEPGKPEESLLFEYVSTEQMPPKNPLSSDQTAVLKRWITDGAFFPDKPLDLFSITTDQRAGYDWWSLQPLVEAAPPTPAGLPHEWSKNPIDSFIFAKLLENELAPSAPVTSRVLIRRATYDLIGLPPTPEEVIAFRKECELETGSPDRVGDEAYVKLLDRLLASSHYGEHWGRHWLDVVRFGESIGFERNEIVNNAWPFRDYVIRSFNEDKPFDRFILEHLAGDVVGKGDLDVEAGAIFRNRSRMLNGHETWGWFSSEFSMDGVD